MTNRQSYDRQWYGKEEMTWQTGKDITTRQWYHGKIKGNAWQTDNYMINRIWYDQFLMMWFLYNDKSLWLTVTFNMTLNIIETDHV